MLDRIPVTARHCIRKTLCSLLPKRGLHLPGNLQDVQANNTRELKVDRNRLRNIGIIAHINAGKTTTTERILYNAGSTDTVGDVDKGNTVTDYLKQERDRGITITSAAVSYNWKKHRINLIDTPGHVDFTIEVERSLSVLDGAVTILDASAGVEAQTVTVWNQASRYKLPNVIFLNKCDKPQADYLMCMKDLKSSLDMTAALTQIPVRGKGSSNFSSIIDIIERKCITWSNSSQDHGAEFQVIPLEEAKLDKMYSHLVDEGRERLVNSLSDMDDDFASQVLDCDKIGDVSSEYIVKALRRATLACKLNPVLVGSSFRCIGIQQLMDAIVAYLPSPDERETQISDEFGLKRVESPHSCAFIFKIMHDKRLGPLTYLKVTNGSISKSQRLSNVDNGSMEQIKRVYRPFADELREVDSAVERDDIVVATGLLEAKTGDLIGAEKLVGIHEKQQQLSTSTRLPFRLIDDKILVPQISPMEPVYFCSIEAQSGAQQMKLEKALACLQREDPSFVFEVDSLGITTVRGMGKLHLEIIRDRIKTEHGVDASLGPLQISYRETIDGSATESLSISRLVNSVKNTLTISLYVRSLPQAGAWRNKSLRLDSSGENSLSRLRHDQRRAIENGICSALAHGPQLGYPVIDCDVLLLDFKANGRCGLAIISSAASQCLVAALARCSPILLEPIMLLEVVAPAEQNGVILGDLTGTRRANILSTTARANGSVVIRAHSPLSSLANYSEFLRICTSGRASFTMELHNYSAMSDLDKHNVERH